jgi:pimeloyl-ACP methyl ester carboxylesterase
VKSLFPTLAAALAVAGCSRDPQGGSDRTSPASPAASARALPAEGAPQITTSRDGVHIQYRVYGSGEPAIVLVHCWSCDSSYWQSQIEPLAAAYTVVTVDLAGHGASGRNRTDWSIARFAGDVAAAVRGIAASRIILVGHSMGGAVVLEAASQIGERVIGIVGVDTFKRIDQPPPPQAAVDKRIAEFREDFIGTTRAFVTESFFTGRSDPLFIRKIADDMSLAPPEVAIASIAAVNAADFRDHLPRITVPIVAINSDLPPPTDEARIRKLAPTFRAVVIENTGHFLHMEDPARFNPVLLREIAAIAEAK